MFTLNIPQSKRRKLTSCRGQFMIHGFDLDVKAAIKIKAEEMGVPVYRLVEALCRNFLTANECSPQSEDAVVIADVLQYVAEVSVRVSDSDLSGEARNGLRALLTKLASELRAQ